MQSFSNTRNRYTLAVIDDYTRNAAVVDPAEADKVLQAAEREGARITAIWTTHGHWDHVGGNEELAQTLGELQVYGPEEDGVPALTTPVGDGDFIELGAVRATVRKVPFHTGGHVVYITHDAHAHDAPRSVFTGDSLFVGSCGRINAGGTAAQLHHALVEVLGALPDATNVWVGHEYTEANFRFARAVEPDNEELRTKAERIREIRLEGKFSVPSTMAEERATNPFMRPRVAAVREYCGCAGVPETKEGDVQVLGILRQRKNEFGLGSAAGKR